MRANLTYSSLTLFCYFISAPLQARLIQPKVIYGEDNRQEYFAVEDSHLLYRADATVALVHSQYINENAGPQVAQLIGPTLGNLLNLCPSEPFFEQTSAAYCTGFLVTENRVVTAGHCIESQNQCDDVSAVFNFRYGSNLDQVEDANFVDSNEVFHCRKLIYREQDDAGADFAVIELDRSVKNHAPLQLRQTGELKKGEPLVLIGYPSGIPLKIAAGAKVRQIDDKKGFFIANTDSYGGNSGSPVINQNTGEVEGVLVRGVFDYVFLNGCRVSNRCPEDGCNGEGITSISRVLPHVTQ